MQNRKPIASHIFTKSKNPNVGTSVKNIKSDASVQNPKSDTIVTKIQVLCLFK